MDRGFAVSSCRAKIARADHHLKVLYGRVGRWSDLQPCSVVRKANADGSEHVFSLNIDPQPPVWNWAVVLGDALHNLRGALDHIVYQLAINDTGIDPPDDDSRLMFPICSTPELFKKRTIQSRIASLSDAARAGIEKVQPYNRSWNGFAPLWWLGQLNDVDKHRLAVLSPIAADFDEIRVDAQPGTYKVFWN